ncbi:hypothetical protein RB195_001304 [Necator americanus]|uniref:Uncharacterized protein n=2 Tax=Necator americanus TaxID=51031 RepID=A0ABR1DEA6_NECAM
MCYSALHMTAVYFIFCLFGSCLCYLTVISKKSQKRTLRNFVDMWLLFPYALIPAIMHGPSFGVTFLKFAMELLYEWLKESGLLDGEGDSTFIHHLIAAALDALPWFVLLFPLVQAILAVICIEIFRQQFFFVFTCARVYDEPAVAAPKIFNGWVSKISPQWCHAPLETVKMEGGSG